MVILGTTRRRELQRVGALMMAAACGGGDTAPGPIPTIEGHYLGTWTLAVQGDRVDCPAALTITDQVDSTFRTSLELLRRYAPGVGCIDTVEPGVGTVRATGTINALAELVEPMTCTLKEPNVGLTGRVVDDSITLSGRYTYQCPQDFVWTLTFAGSTNGAPLPSYPDVTGAFSGTYTTLVPGGLQVDCPVTVSLPTQVRDDVVGSYELGAAGSCIAQPPEALAGVVTIDGYLELSGAPPTPSGCSVQRPLVVAGGVTDDSLSLGGTFLLLCGSTRRELGVVISATRTGL
jgi:hypothetical protein